MLLPSFCEICPCSYLCWGRHREINGGEERRIFIALLIVLQCRLFIPTIQIKPAAGARTLLHIGTHRREYEQLDPNHLYYMQWRLRGLERSPYVEDVSLTESREVYQWIDSLYRKLKQVSCEVEGVSERLQEVMKKEEGGVVRGRSQSF